MLQHRHLLTSFKRKGRQMIKKNTTEKYIPKYLSKQKYKCIFDFSKVKKNNILRSAKIIATSVVFEQLLLPVKRAANYECITSDFKSTKRINAKTLRFSTSYQHIFILFCKSNLDGNISNRIFTLHF